MSFCFWLTSFWTEGFFVSRSMLASSHCLLAEITSCMHIGSRLDRKKTFSDSLKANTSGEGGT